MTPMLDWHGVLSGQPLQWIISGFLTTVWVSVAGILLSTLLAVLLLALRLGGGRAGRGLVAAWVSLFRNTPLLVQLLFWYFAAWNLLPLAVKEVVNDEHAWSILPGNVWWLTPEFLCSMWGLGVFTSAFLVEEIASGLRAVSHGQLPAAGGAAVFTHVQISLHRSSLFRERVGPKTLPLILTQGRTVEKGR